MSTAPLSMAEKVLVLSLAFILGSCSAPRYSVAGPTGPHDLAKYVIVLEQQPDGQVTHAWVPLEEFNLAKFQRTLSTINVRRLIVNVSSSGLNDYCDGRHDQCVNDCLNSSRPFVIGGRKYMDTQAQPWRTARSWWCPSNCMEELIRCKRGRGEWAEQYAAEFDTIDTAIDWIKRHREELAVGAVVVIAGVAFAVVIAGSGGAVLALAPLLLMAELPPESPLEAQLVEACR